MKIKYKKLRPDAIEPMKMTAHAAGYDLSAALDEKIELLPGKWQGIPTGIAIELPCGFEVQIRPRSGLALNHGIGILNSPGTIDADYRGEIKIILINHSDSIFIIEPGMRIAQMLISTVVETELVCSTELSESQRQDGGFGHTGV